MGASVGITVGVDGENEYVRSLKNITAETKAFQSELKTLESSFGKSTSTWDKSQMKASVLTDAIDAQYKKLEMLKEAQDKVAEGSTKWYDYADKINKATNALNEMEHELEKLPNHIQAIGQDFEAWGKKIEKAGTSISKTGDKLTKTVTTPIVGGLTAAVKETSDFDTAMAEVKAIAVTTQEQLGRISAEEALDQFTQLREKARQLGRETVYSATESANAMSYLARAGWTTEQIISGIDGVMSLAAADGLDLATTASIVADGVTAFGRSADYASEFADILAMTSAQSNTNVEMLGDSFKYVAPTAAALGYEIEDVALALGLSANAGVKASQAGTGLRQALKNLISPTDKVEAAASKFGVTLYDDAGAALPFSQVIDQLRSVFGDLEISIMDENGELKEGEAIMSEYADSLPISQQEKLQALVDIFGTRAMPTMLSIVNASADDFGRLEEAIYNTQGAAESMAKTRLDNIGGDLTLLKDELLDLAIEFGDIMVPVLRDDIIPMVREVVGWFSSLDDGTKEMIIKAGLLAAAVGPVLSVGGRLITGIGGLVGGIGKVLTVVGGLAGTGATIAGGISSVVGAIGAGATGLVGALGSAVTAIGGVIAAIGPALLIATAVIAVVGVVAYEVYKHWDDIKAWTKNLVDNIKDHWNNLKEKTHNAWENIKKSVSDNADEFARNSVENVRKMQKTFDTVWSWLKTSTSETWSKISGFVGTAASNMKTWISDAASNMWDTLSRTFSDIAGKAWEWGSGVINGLCEGLNSAWSWLSGTVGGLASTISDTLGGLASSAWNWGKEIASGLGDGIKSGYNWVKEKASGLANTIGQYIHFSEPDKGALSDLHRFMPDMMKQLAQGIYQNMNLVENASDALASALLPNVNTGVIQGRGGKNIAVTNGDTVINVYGASGQDVNELADIVMRKLTVQVNRQAVVYG